jgi:photosystem II stability/assembly factor-like uncharacterized protein
MTSVTKRFCPVRLLLLLAPLIASSQDNPWQQMAFPAQYGGLVWGFHETSHGVLLAGTWMDGLGRSTDNGETWSQALEYGSYASQIASMSGGTVFCGKGDGGGLYRSTNDGATWSLVGPHGTNGSIRGIIVNSLDQIFISDAGGPELYRSTDAGATWTPRANGLSGTYTPGQMVVSHFNGAEFLFLIAQNYVTSLTTLYRSTADGDLWTPMTSQSYMDHLFAHSNGYLFFAGPSGVMRSTNNGSSWQVAWPYEFNTQQMISLANGEIWSGNNYGPLLRSTDNGITWTEFSGLGMGNPMGLIQTHDASVFVGTEGTGIFRTTDDGKTWQQKNAGFPNSSSQVNTIGGLPDGFMVAGSSKFGGFVSTNSGADWVRMYPGPGNAPSRVVVHPGGRIYVGSSGEYMYGGMILKSSTDAGASWNAATWFVQGTNNPIFSSDAAVDVVGNLYSCGQGTGVIRSTDAGETWTWLPCPGQTFTRMHVSGSGIIVVQTPYAESNPYRQYYFTRISTDGGVNWNQSSPGGSMTQTYEYGSTGNGYLFAGTAAGVYRSTNYGGTWEPTGLTLPDVKSFAVNSSNAFFTGSATHGVFTSPDFGATWIPFSAGLTDSAITSLYCDTEGFLFAGTETKGIFRTALKTTGFGGPERSLPAAFALLQNYPNPFNPTTVIRFQLPALSGVEGPVASNVRLTVYDLLGQEVALLIDGRMDAGVHQVTFNASHLATGTYVYRLSAGSYAASRKMMFLK